MTHTTPTEAREVADRLEAKKLDVRTWVAVTALLSLADQLEAVTAERDAYKLDADRYRWFAEIATSGDFDKAEKAFLCFSDAKTCSKEELDAAIDAAIAKEKTT